MLEGADINSIGPPLPSLGPRATGPRRQEAGRVTEDLPGGPYRSPGKPAPEKPRPIRRRDPDMPGPTADPPIRDPLPKPTWDFPAPKTPATPQKKAVEPFGCGIECIRAFRRSGRTLPLPQDHSLDDLAGRRAPDAITHSLRSVAGC